MVAKARAFRDRYALLQQGPDDGLGPLTLRQRQPGEAGIGMRGERVAAKVVPADVLQGGLPRAAFLQLTGQVFRP